MNGCGVRSLQEQERLKGDFGLDIDRAARHAYAAVRDALPHEKLSDEGIAREALSFEVAPRIAAHLAKQLATEHSKALRSSTGALGLRAFVESHDPDFEIEHTFALLGNKEDPDHDIIIDGNYQLFLDCGAQRTLPLVFVGSREEMQGLIEELAVDPVLSLYYQQETLSRDLTKQMAAEFGVPHPRL